MKKIILLSIFFCAIASVALADFSVSDWKYYKDINWQKGGLVKISLDDEIFSQSRKDLGDVRIISEENKEVPFKLVVGKEEISSERYFPKMINNSFSLGNFSSVILDFGEESRLVNQISIQTESENFQRNVKIYGSNDQQNWNILKNDGYIYDYSDKKAQFKSQNTAVSFPQSNFRYLKIEVADENNNPVRIGTVSAVNFFEKKARELERNPHFEVSNDNEEKTSEVIVDIGSQGIPTSKVTFFASDNNFNRGILIYSSANKSDWNFIGQGYIFRYNTDKFKGENLSVNFSETKNQYLKIVVRNNDNEPLNFNEIKTFSIYRELAFQAENDKTYRIFYGNSKASYPEYDIEKYWQYLDENKAIKADVSVQKNNPGYIPEKDPEEPFSERFPYLLSLALTVSSLIMIFLVFLFFQKKDSK